MRNKFFLMGRLGDDPQCKVTKSGKPVARMSVATSHKNGKTEWHKVVAFEKAAEIAEKYGKKGALVDIEGTLQTRTWTDNRGNERKDTEVKVQFINVIKDGKQPEAAPNEIPF